MELNKPNKLINMSETVEAPEFSDEQLRDALKRVGTEAQRISFVAGRPIVYLKGKYLIALHQNGTEQVLKPVQHGAEYTD